MLSVKLWFSFKSNKSDFHSDRWEGDHSTFPLKTVSWDEKWQIWSIEAKECDPQVQQKVKEVYQTTDILGTEKRKAAVEAGREEEKNQKTAAQQEDILDSQQSSSWVSGNRVLTFMDQRNARFWPLGGCFQ